MRLINLIAAALICVSASGAQAATLDQNFVTTDDPNNNTGVGFVTTSLGQSFTVGVTGIFHSLSFNILKIAGTTGDISVELRNMVGGSPDVLLANALASATVLNSEIDTFGGQPYDWTTITLDFSGAGLFVNAGDQLAFTVTSTIDEKFGIQTDYTDAYAGGARFSQNGDGSAFASLSTADLAFSTSVSAVPLPAGLPLLLSGFAAFAWMRRKSSALG